MVKSSKKKPSAFSSMFGSTGPKTIKGKARKAMFGDGRRTLKSQSKDDTERTIYNFFGVKTVKK